MSLVRCGAALVLLAPLALLTWQRAAVFRNETALWSDTLRRNPASWLAHSNLGNVYLGQRDAARAQQHFAAALRLKPDYEVTHYNVGLMLALAGDFAGAIERYGEALRIHPAFTDAYCRLASCAMMTRQYADAEDALRKALALEPDRFDIHYQLAALLHMQGRTREATTEYRAAIRLNPFMPDALNNLAWILATHPDAQVRNGVEALELAERACRMSDFKHPVFLSTLAAAYAETGDFDRAIQTDARAAELALAAGATEQVKQSRQRMEIYGHHEPVREGQ